jgi:ribonuclease BN (tRNA processing enzyme)
MKKILWKRKSIPLPLTTEGPLRLFFIGVGGAFSKKHNQTNLLILKGEDHLLIDCGTKCPQALWELKLPITAIHNILITHSHADHIGGLEESALLGRFFAKKKPKMIITAEYEKILWEMSLKGGSAFNERTDGRYLEFADFFEIVRPEPYPGLSRDAWEAHCNSIDLILFRTMHIPDSAQSWKDSVYSLGMIIDGRVLFSSDTRFDPVFVRELDDRFHLEALFHDCQFFTAGVHASLFELKELPRNIKRKTYLTHFGDDFQKYRAKVKEFGFAGLAKQNVFYEF